MKKLTKLHAILIILLVAVIAISFYFSFNYRGAEAKQPDLVSEINMARQKLIIVQEENDPEPLKQQLEELRSVINKLKQGEPLFPDHPDTVGIGDLIVDSVERLNLTLLKLSPNDDAGTVTIDSGSEDIEDNKYSTAEYEVKVKGDLGRINSLIGDIENAYFASMNIEDMEIEFNEEEVDGVYMSWWEAEFTVVTLYQYEEEEE